MTHSQTLAARISNKTANLTVIGLGYVGLPVAARFAQVGFKVTGLEVNRFQPRTPDFEFPADFKLEDYVARHPWEIRAHDPVKAVVRFEAPVAGVLAAELGAQAHKVEEDGDARIFHLEVSYLDGLLPTVLWYRDKARVLEPPELVEKIRAALERMTGDR